MADVVEGIDRGVNKVEKKSKGVLTKLAPLLFLLGIIIAIVVGLAIGAEVMDSTDDSWGYIAGTLAGLGFLIGIATALGTGTITKEEVTQFLVGAIAIVVAGIGGSLLQTTPLIGEYIYGVTISMIYFFSPAAVVIALKTLWDLGKD